MTVFDEIRTFVQQNVHAITSELYLGYTGTTTPGNDPTVLNAAVAASINNRITILEGAGVLTRYTTSATWTNPTPAAHKLITVICINGGSGGGKGPTNAIGPVYGGQSGGYISQQFYTDALTSTVAMTIGAGGAGSTTANTRGDTGGVTSFGAYLVGVPGYGGIFKADGSYAITVPPGRGGDGALLVSGTSINTFIPAQDGHSGPFAVGGLAGLAAAGSNGADAPAGIPSGGGGGGGGGVNSTGTTGFVGGAGGFPGGGGGAGGQPTSASPSPNGGAGAAGCIYVIT